MTNDNTKDEFYEIIDYVPILKKIHNYENYFIIDNITWCKPDTLTKEDLEDFNKCTALKRYNITSSNINEQLKYLSMLNEPDGGLELDEYIKLNFNSNKMILLNNSLINLLKNGIIPMNHLHIYHLDIKGSNILVDDNSKGIITRLIDWGLSEQLKQLKDTNNTLYKLSMHPYQFNLPYSIIIFYYKFNNLYTKFISNKIKTYDEIYLFTMNYLNEYKNSNKGGHLHINIKDLKLIFNDNNYISIICKYISTILFKYTKNNKLYLDEYLPIFLHNVDIWGFVSAYEGIIDVIRHHKYLNNSEIQIINCFKKIFTLLFESNLIKINIYKLIELLNELNPLFKPDSSERKITNIHYIKINVQKSKSKLTNELKIVARGIQKLKKKV